MAYSKRNFRIRESESIVKDYINSNHFAQILGTRHYVMLHYSFTMYDKFNYSDFTNILMVHMGEIIFPKSYHLMYSQICVPENLGS